MSHDERIARTILFESGATENSEDTVRRKKICVYVHIALKRIGIHGWVEKV